VQFEDKNMSDYTVMLTISKAIYERARHLSEATTRSVEQILSSQLAKVFTDLTDMPQDAQVDLSAFRQLSNEALRTFAHEQTPSELRQSATLLLALNKRVVLTPDEESELDQLLESVDWVMLRKAQAGALLTQRGYKVTPDAI
jgi:hypothetical protein